MATDINPPVESWGTLSMKPDPGEEINALWGDKIAANTGWLFAHQKNSLIRDVVQGSFQGYVSSRAQFYSLGQVTLRFNLWGYCTNSGNKGNIYAYIDVPDVGQSSAMEMTTEGPPQVWGPGLEYTFNVSGGWHDCFWKVYAKSSEGGTYSDPAYIDVAYITQI